MRIVVVALACAALAIPAFAGQASAVFESPDGSVRLRVAVTDPEGEIGVEHFEAITFRTPAGGRAPLTLSPDSAAALPPRGFAGVRRVQSESGRSMIDWSDARVEVHAESVSMCVAGLYGEVEGLLRRGKSAFFVMDVSMAHITVLSSMRGDADLYVYDAYGGLVCASDFPRWQRIADQCAYLASDCATMYIPSSLIEVRGLRKRNEFHLSIWVVDAI